MNVIQNNPLHSIENLALTKILSFNYLASAFFQLYEDHEFLKEDEWFNKSFIDNILLSLPFASVYSVEKYGDQISRNCSIYNGINEEEAEILSELEIINMNRHDENIFNIEWMSKGIDSFVIGFSWQVENDLKYFEFGILKNMNYFRELEICDNDILLFLQLFIQLLNTKKK
jgi:hypothetical protein